MYKKITSHIKKKSPAITAFVLILSVMIPVLVLAAENPLIPCDGVSTKCEFKHVVILVNNVISFIINISITVASGMLIWAGILYATAGPDTGKTSRAKGIFKAVIVGFLVMFSAWLIVYTIVKGLTGQDIGAGFLKKIN